MFFTDWADVARDLTRSLEALEEGEFLVLGESDLAPAPRRGLFGRRSPARGHPLRAGPADHRLPLGGVRRRHVAGRHLGHERGHHPAAATTSAGSPPRRAGPQYGTVTPNFELYVDLADTAALACLLVASLQLLDVQPQHLELVTSSGDARSSAG